MGEKLCFRPNLSSYNIRFQFQLVHFVNFNFNFGFLVHKFLSNSLANFFPNLDPNSMFFYYVNLPSSYLKFIKIPNFSPHLNVRFDQILKNT